jgi:small subunit ribosomal protein S14
MTNSIQRDKRRRLLLLQFQLKRLQRKTVSQDLNLSKSTKKMIDSKRALLPRNSSRSRVHNRCIITGRSRGVLRFCKLSRIRVRKLASQGLLSGISKASW